MAGRGWLDIGNADLRLKLIQAIEELLRRKVRDREALRLDIAALRTKLQSLKRGEHHERLDRRVGRDKADDLGAR